MSAGTRAFWGLRGCSEVSDIQSDLCAVCYPTLCRTVHSHRLRFSYVLSKVRFHFTGVNP